MAKNTTGASGYMKGVSTGRQGLKSGQVYCRACGAVVTSACPHSQMTSRERRRMKTKEEKRVTKDRGAPGDRGFEKKSDEQRAKEIKGQPPEKKQR